MYSTVFIKQAAFHKNQYNTAIVTWKIVTMSEL